MQFSTSLRNARLDLVETHIGASAILYIFQGAKPAATTDADVGTVLATLNLPADWMANASGGTKLKSGTWEDISADATGTAEYFRVKDTTGITTHIQGTITVTGGGGDMTVDNVAVAITQQITVTQFTLLEGNA